MTRVGAVDCGTNSIRLLVADVDETGSLTDVVRRMEVVRLGAGVDRTGAIEPEAMARTLAMARQYAGQCRELGAETVRFVATSASRDASNAGEFVAGVREAFAAFGTAPEVVTGDEEATLSFRGATGGL
ncbi:MAG: Ppx/GppA phosphatase family protein, partial [Nocardioides sp.]